RTPWPSRKGRRHHRVFWRRTLQASGGGFSFGRSWWRLVLYGGHRRRPTAPGQGVGMKRKNGSKQGPMRELRGKPVSASRSEMTEIVLPAMTNPLGKLLGGQVMHLVD